MGENILTSDQKKVLAFLSKDPVFSKHFYFTGGTPLSAYYLHHRYSEDLDFFSEEEVDLIWLTSLKDQIKRVIGALSGEVHQAFNRNLLFFYLTGGALKTEFTYFPFKQIEPVDVISGLRVDSLKDMAVNKFFTIYQKPSARNFIDLYLILKRNEFSWEELRKLAGIKFDTPIDSIQLGAQLITAENISDLPRMIQTVDEKEWRAYFLEKAKELKNSIC